jgi:hypothetical protein
MPDVHDPRILGREGGADLARPVEALSKISSVKSRKVWLS